MEVDLEEWWQDSEQLVEHEDDGGGLANEPETDEPSKS